MTDWSRFSATPPGGEPAPAGGGADWSRFSAEPPPKPTLFQQAKSGLSRSFEEVPGLVAGVGAYAADAVGATDTRDSLLGYAQRKQEEVGAKHANDAQSFTDAWDGKTPWLDFLANSAGYVVGQVAQSIVTGGVGAVGGKMLATQAMKQAGEVAAAKLIATGATEAAVREGTEAAMRAVANKAMTRGGIAGAGTQNIGMELGSIYPEAVNEVGGADNLDAGDKGRVLASSLAAAGVDTLADVVMAGRILKGSKAGAAVREGEKPPGIMGRAAREVPAGMAREAGTEAIQTGIEHYGAGQPIADEKGLRDIIDSAAVGAVGGGMGGGIASLRRAAPALPDPVTKGINEIAAAPTVDDAINAFADSVSGKPAAPTFGDRIASVKADASRETMAALREKYGPDSATEFLNSLARAQNPRVPTEVREKHLQAVETMLFELRATREPEAPAPLALTGPDAQPALGYDGAPPQLGMGSTPTGTMRVGPDGQAFPETAADVTAGRQDRMARDGLTAQSPWGREAGAGVMQGDGTLTPGVTRREPAPQTAMAQALLPLADRIQAMRRPPTDPVKGPDVTQQPVAPTRAQPSAAGAAPNPDVARSAGNQAGSTNDGAVAVVEPSGAEAAPGGRGAADGEQALTAETAIRKAAEAVPGRVVGSWSPITVEHNGRAQQFLSNIKRVVSDGKGPQAVTLLQIRPGRLLAGEPLRPMVYGYRLTRANQLVEEGIPREPSEAEAARWGAAFGEQSAPTKSLKERAEATKAKPEAAPAAKPYADMTPAEQAAYDAANGITLGRRAEVAKQLDAQNAAAPASQQPAASPGAAVGPAAAAPATPRVPKSFRKRHKVKTRVFDEETGAFEEQESDADTALMAIQADISELRAFRLCLTGG